MRLLTIMERHIRDGLHLQLQCGADQVRNIFCATNINFMDQSCTCASLVTNLCCLYPHVHVYVAANFLSQVSFAFLLFLVMVMYAYEVETKKK